MVDTPHIERNAPAVLQDDTPQAGATPMLWLLWLLLLLAVAAFAWWYFTNRATTAPPVAQDLAIIEGTAADAPAAAQGGRKSAASPRRNHAANDDVATAASTVRNPQLLSAALPRYPAEERRRGVQGDVTLRIDVGANGVPTDVDYAHRSGNRALDRAALTAARDWRFRPAIRNGEAVASTVNVPVAFRL